MVKYTKEQVKQMEEIVNKTLEDLENLDIEVIEELIFVEQIEGGENKRENFHETITKMGLPYTKKGRIPFEEVEEIAVELCELLKNSKNPKSDIKDIMNLRRKEGVEKINNRIEKSKKIRERDKKETINRNNTVHKEIKSLEKKGVNVNQNLFWDIYIIKRGEKREERFIEDGQDIELLKFQNSFISNEDMERLKELRSEHYEE